jgi:hypothetical protein
MSVWAGPEMKHCVELGQRAPRILATGDRSGLTAEYPFGANTSLLRLVTDAENPRLGHGLLALLTVPRKSEGPEVAMELNALELSRLTRSHFLGTWCDDEMGLTYCAFYPNVARVPGLLPNIFFSTASRAKWFAEEILGQPWQDTYQAALEAKAARLKELASLSRKRGLVNRIFGRR